MSTLAVRTAFRTELAAWCAAHTPAIEFHDTINKNVKPASNFWVTTSFFTTGSQLLTFCGRKDETGYCEVIIFCKAGIGDNEVLLLADEIAADFIGYQKNGLVVEEIDAPMEFTSGEAKQGQYGISMFINYSYVMGLPINIEAPIITGNHAAGSILTCSTGEWV